MELPDLPESLKISLNGLEVRDKHFTWSIRNTGSKIVVNLIWKDVSLSTSNLVGNDKRPAKSPKKQQDISKPQGQHTAALLQQKHLAKSIKKKKKKKSPSRIERDRKRLLVFREKKKREQHQEAGQSPSPSEPASPPADHLEPQELNDQFNPPASPQILLLGNSSWRTNQLVEVPHQSHIPPLPVYQRIRGHLKPRRNLPLVPGPPPQTSPLFHST